MKKIIIIDTYPSTKEHMDCLFDCVNLLKDKGYDLMITSHLPVSSKIQDKVDYFIYDKDNSLLPYDLTPYSWMDNESFYLQTNARGHQVTICKNMYNGISMAKNLKYDFFFFMEADNLFDGGDFDILDGTQTMMFELGKKMVFFKYLQNDCKVYETLIFGGCPSYFLEKADLPVSIDEYVEWVSVDGSFRSESLEYSFYRKFNKKNEILEIEGTSLQLFENSVINKYSGCDYLCEVLTNNLDDRFILFIKNFGTKMVDFKIDGVSNITNPGGWSYRFLDNNVEISVLIYDGDEIVGRRHFFVNDMNRQLFSEKAYIKFK